MYVYNVLCIHIISTRYATYVFSHYKKTIVYFWNNKKGLFIVLVWCYLIYNEVGFEPTIYNMYAPFWKANKVIVEICVHYFNRKQAQYQ